MSEGTNVGVINLGLDIDRSLFNKQLNGIASGAQNSVKNAFKPIGSTIGKVLAAGSIVAFTKSCLDLGSGLSEVQNVVDVTFSEMTSKVNKFASTAIKQFGLSETVAKKMMGTYGSMSKSFGFNPQEVYDMSAAITGLTGDVASFYNLSTDEAYTKMKSIWTGETESLKELGVVMTQTALDQYALNNGFGKTTAAMTEQEKVMLRYQYVQSQLSDASGDFARTQDGWANQTRVLTLRFEQLKATLGQGFINLFTPIVKMLNTFIGVLQNAANAFLRLTEIITGKEIGSMGNVASGVSDVASAAGDASSNIAGMGDSAASAVKKAERALMGFDQIQKINETSASGGGSGSASGGTASSSGSGVIADELSKSNAEATKLEKTIARIKTLFSEGFSIGLGDTDFSKISSHLEGIKASLLDIFSDKAVSAAIDNFAKTFVENLGKITGAATSVGETVCENLIGGIDKYLSQNKEKIKQAIADIFNIESEKAEIIGNFSVAIADIFSIFRSDNAKQITADIIAIFTDGFTNVVVLAEKLGRDILDCVLSPITENSELLKEKFGDLLKPISGIISTIKESVEKGFKSIQTSYDTYIKPAFETVRDVFSDFLSGDFAKFLSNLKKDLSKISSNLKPIIEKLQPIQDFFTAITAQTLGVAITALGTICKNAFSSICDIIGGITKTLSGVVEFVSGVFTGNWKKAFNGLKTVAEGIFKTLIESMLSLFGIDKFKDKMSNLWTGISDWWEDKKIELKAGISAVFKDKKTAIKKKWDNLTKNVKDVTREIKGNIGQKWSDLKSKWKELTENIKDITREFKGNIGQKWSDLKEKWKKLTENVKDVTREFKGEITQKWSDLKEKWQSLTENIKDITKEFKGKITQKWSDLKEKWQSLTENVKDITKEFKGKITQKWSDLKEKWKSLTENIKDKTVELKLKVASTADGIKNAINKIIDNVNKNVIAKIKLTAPSNWPIIGGKTIGPPPKIPPFYATGGFPEEGPFMMNRGEIAGKFSNGKGVVANNKQITTGISNAVGPSVFKAVKSAMAISLLQVRTPQLAVTSAGSSEDRMLQRILDVLTVLASGGANEETILILKELLAFLKTMNRDVYMDGEKVTKIIEDTINRHTDITGTCPVHT